MCRIAAVGLLLVSSFACIAQEGGAAARPEGIEPKYRYVKGYKVGAYLADKYPGKRVLVLLPPEMPTLDGKKYPATYEAMLLGIKEGMGDKLKIVEALVPETPFYVKAALDQAAAGGGKVGPGLAPWEWFTVPRMNEELALYKGKYDLLICLTILPGTVQRGGEGNPVPFTYLDVMKDENVKVVVMEGPVSRLSEQPKSGQVAAVVTYRQNVPEADFESPPPDDMSKAFPMRFVLITPETLHQYSSYFLR